MGKFVPPTIQTTEKFREFELLYLRDFSTLSSGVKRFSLTCPSQKIMCSLIIYTKFCFNILISYLVFTITSVVLNKYSGSFCQLFLASY